jgi:hypothetical protein
MKRHLILVALVLAISTAVVLGQSARGGGSTVQPVSLNVVIDDAVSQSLHGIGSDGGGTYVNGIDGAGAAFGTNGYFTFKTGNRTAKAFYSTPVELTGPQLTGSSTASMTLMTFVNGFYLQNMTVGGPPRCEGLIASWDLSSKLGRNIGYQAGRAPYAQTAYMLVSHPDANTWIMDSYSAGACSAYDNIATISDSSTKGAASNTFYGRYNMPLRLILTRQ